MSEPAAKPRKRRTPVIGPLFAWDLIRLARRGQDARSRTILSLVLLLTLMAFTVIWFRTTDLSDLFFGTQQELSIQESARFADNFSLALLLAQLGVMVLLTPAYAAGSVAEEKERGTWQYLLTTDLSNREIVLGKFCGRVVFLLGVMMAGLPVLSLTALIGGVEPLFLAFAYLLTGSTVVLVAAIGITAAIYASTFRGAMFRAYGFMTIFVVLGGGVTLISPFVMLVFLHRVREDSSTFLIVGCGYIIAQCILAACVLGMGIARIRRVERRGAQRRRDRDRVDRARRAPPRLVAQPVGTAAKKREKERWGETEDRRERRKHTSPEWADKPPIASRDPFYWKEKYTLGTTRTSDDESIRSMMTVVGVIVAILLAFVVLIGVLVGLGNPRSGRETMSEIFLLCGMTGVFLHLMTLGPAACGAVIREKARLTLESLLTIPVPRRAILEPKWLITFRRGWWWGGPGAACVVLGFAASEITPAALPAAIYLPAAAALCVSFGLWLSCRCTTTVRAVMIYLSLAGTLAMIPMSIWWSFDERNMLIAVILMSMAALLATVSAWIFWKMAVKEFESYGRE